MARGLSTLFHFGSLMNPFRYGVFALMLLSHKLLRWLPFLFTPVAILALGVLATQNGVAAILFAAVGLGVAIGVSGIVYRRATVFKPVALAGFVVASTSAGFLAWCDAIRGARMVIWDPTPRPSISTGWPRRQNSPPLGL
jgi:hypothetical protein